MNIRQAILKAADHIEANPNDFAFNSVDEPEPCGTPGCALGWIGFFAGIKAKIYESHVSAVAEAMNVQAMDFYDRMDQFCGSGWIDQPEICSRALRGYADEYHPAA